MTPRSPSRSPRSSSSRTGGTPRRVLIPVRVHVRGGAGRSSGDRSRACSRGACLRGTRTSRACAFRRRRARGGFESTAGVRSRRRRSRGCRESASPSPPRCGAMSSSSWRVAVRSRCGPRTTAAVAGCDDAESGVGWGLRRVGGPPIAVPATIEPRSAGARASAAKVRMRVRMHLRVHPRRAFRARSAASAVQRHLMIRLFDEIQGAGPPRPRPGRPPDQGPTDGRRTGW